MITLKIKTRKEVFVVGQVEDNYRRLEEKEACDRNVEEINNIKVITDFLKLTQEVIDCIISKSKTISPKDYEWIYLDGEKMIGWCIERYREDVGGIYLCSNGRMVDRRSCSEDCSLFFPVSLLSAKHFHRALLSMAEYNFGIKPKKHWILKEDKKGFAKLFG